VTRPVPFADAATDFEQLKLDRRISVLDLARADLNPDRAQFDHFIQSRIAVLVASTSPDRYHDMWQSLIVEADRCFSWQPPEVSVRPISQTPSAEPLVRHATRVIAMVHELHKAGYQRIRMLPYLAPSGCFWRCAITYSDNIEDDGYHIRNEDYDGHLVAPYTTGDDNQCFGWKDAGKLSARELAVRFLREFPLIAERGQGRDWMYAGWVTDVLGRAELGTPDDLLYLIADCELDEAILREWQPPPPLRRP
jgi:hypothetical protein